MKGGIKTKAGKNRLIPIAHKILPLIEWFFKPVNEYLLTVNGAPLLNVQNLRQQVWSKSPLLANHDADFFRLQINAQLISVFRLNQI